MSGKDYIKSIGNTVINGKTIIECSSVLKHQALAAIALARKEERERINKWINVNDRKPKEFQRVLTYPDIPMLYKNGKFFYKGTLCYEDNIEYWMPIPELPKK